MKIGIDVGGTHTDAVVLDGDEVVGSYKAATSDDVMSGMSDALKNVIETTKLRNSDIKAVMLGTTQFTNAVVERRQLSKVAAVRLGLPAGACLPPMVDWPEDLAEALGHNSYMVHGGNEYDGSLVSALDLAELGRVFEKIAASDVQAVAISSVFSPLFPETEARVAKLLQDRIPAMPVVLSHELGRLGLLERENAALLNASLLKMAERVVSAMREALLAFDIDVPFFVSQNDGTVVSTDHVLRYPISTFSSGPTNSMRGAAHLAGLSNAIVADVGGTTTDVGMLIDGFPRISTWAVELGGVRSNFRMPDVLALGLGGGSTVSDNGAVIGPKSVGHALQEDAVCFGGETLTATDVAVACGRVKLGDSARVASIQPRIVDTAMACMQEKVARVIDRVKTGPDPMPLIVVGGGEFLVGDSISGISKVHRPMHGNVANAVGAALAQVSGECEVWHHPKSEPRDDVLKELCNTAKQRALDAGAVRGSIEIVSIDEVPIPYMGEETARIHVRAVGDMDIH